MPQAVLYIRWSSERQGAGDSDRRQRVAGEKWARENGYELRVIVDKGLSAYTEENLTEGQLGLFLRDINAGRVEPGTCVIVESLDRLSRGLLWRCINLTTGIVLAGLSIVELREDAAARIYRDDDSMEDLLMMMMTFSRGRNESSTKQKRVREAWDQIRLRAVQGRPVTTTVPYAYRLVGRTRDAMGRVVEPGRIEVQEDEVLVVQTIFELSAKGWSMNAIARALSGGVHNEGGHTRPAARQAMPELPMPTPVPSPRKGKGQRNTAAWSAATIQYVLKNRSYLGEYHPHTGSHKHGRTPIADVIPDYYPRIIQDDLWHKVHDLHKLQKGIRTNTKRGGAACLTTGIATCSKCGGALMVIWKGGADVPRYVCTNGKNGSGLCAYESIIGTQFEEWILDAVGCHLEEDARKEERQGPDVKPFEQQIVKLKRERTKVEADLKAARRGLLLLPEGEDRAPYVAEIREMEAQAATITDQIASNERQIASARQRREEVWRLAQDWTARVTRAVHGRHTVQLPGGYLTDESISDEEYDRMMESISDLTPLTQGEQDRERIEIKNLLRRLVERIVVNMETRRFTVTFLDGEEIDGEILDLTLHGGDGDMIEVDD